MTERWPIRVIGLDKRVQVIGSKGRVSYLAKVDTGADKSAISIEIANEVGANPTGETVSVAQAGRRSSRETEIVRVAFQIDDEVFELEAYKVDRSTLSRQVRIGRDILLRSDFIIVPRLSSGDQ